MGWIFTAEDVSLSSANQPLLPRLEGWSIPADPSSRGVGRELPKGIRTSQTPALTYVFSLLGPL